MLDAEAAVNSDNLSKLITASGNQVDAHWPGLFASAVGSFDLLDLLSNVGSGGVAAAPAGATAAAAAAPAEEEKEPEEEEADVNVGDIFAQEDDY